MEPVQRGPIGRFFRFIVLIIRNYFIVVGVLVTALPFLIAAFLPSFKNAGARQAAAHVHLSKDQPSSLRLRLAGPITANEPDLQSRLFSRFFRAGSEVNLPELRTALRLAATDERVNGLDIEVSSLSGTAATYVELRNLLVDFRKSGKKITATLLDGEDWPYFVATAANRVVLNPASPITITGPTFHLVYFGDALRKLGVDINVVRAGKYKSAFEPLVLNQPSPATLEEYNSMQESLLGYVTRAVAASRGKDPATVLGWYRQSIFSVDEAIKNGLVDASGYGPAISVNDKGKTLEPTTVADYLAAEGSRPEKDAVSGHGGIGVITAKGEISLTEKGGISSDEGIAPAQMRRQIRWAQQDDDVKAVVLRVDSPGGSAIASDVIWKDLKDLAAVKPLVVDMGTYAASGGYYISTPARYIVAEPTTITGSIGVIGMIPDFAPFEEKYGVSFHVVTGSNRKSLLSMGMKPDPKDLELMNATIDQVYKVFLARVAEGRHLKVERVAEIAQGRAYSALQAKDLGLVDEIGGPDAAFRQAKKLAGLDPTKLYPVYHYEDESLDLSKCLSGFTGLMRCMRGGGVTLGLPGQAAALSGGDAVQRVATHARAWLDEAAHEHALALWTGYLSLSEP